MNILLPIDDSDASKKAVGFVGRTLGQRQGDDVTVTLFHAVESLPRFIASRAGDGGADEFQRVAEQWYETAQAGGDALLERHKQALIEAGVPAAAIETKLHVEPARPGAGKVAVAIAVIQEMKSGPYSVICLGRRGETVYEGSFIGSVAEKVLREASGRTVWVVD